MYSRRDRAVDISDVINGFEISEKYGGGYRLCKELNTCKPRDEKRVEFLAGILKTVLTESQREGFPGLLTWLN